MTTERKLIEGIQDALGEMKKGLRELQKLNTEAGRHNGANIAMGLRGELMVWHSKATVELTANYPEFSDEIQTRGGGGR